MAERFMKQGAVIEMAVSYFPAFLRARKQALALDAWMNGDQYAFSDEHLDSDDPAFGRPYSPEKATTAEYENIRGLSPNNFAGLIVTTLAQTVHLEGISRPGQTGVLPIWETFRRNRWGTTANAIHRGAIGQAMAYGVVIPGTDPLTGTAMSKMIGKSANRMAAFYDSEDDEWATIAIEAVKRYEPLPGGLGVMEVGWFVQIYDAYVIHRLHAKGDGLTSDDWEYIDHIVHGLPVPPVARCANRLDLDGRARGEIEPVLPLLRRIDQDVFDRLINQRFGAWQVRYIAGMAKPTKADAERAQALQLRIQDMLISTDPKTKFGVLPGGSIENQIQATDADLRLLSAISQTPPHHLLGLSSNLQAEALAAATEGLQRKSFDFKVSAGEFHEQMARLASMAQGDFVTAAAFDLRTRFQDDSSTSLIQAANALGILATTLKVPIEMLWERIPGWTDDDVQRAKELVESGGIEQLLNELLGDQEDAGGQQGASGADAQ